MTIIKLFLLLMVISFEKVVGLPMIFVTLVLIFFVNDRNFYKYIYLVFGAAFLAIAYGLSMSFSLILLVFLVLAVSYGGNIIASDINRVLLLIYSLIILIAIVSQIVWQTKVVGYFIISSLVMIIILMKTLFFKHGLTGKITGKKSNFFR
ncbi:hypothetical protein KKD03_01180 [Patescibacteria group bacterium]|nr:hypothetical protein [Patescibacteria group bacterium]